MTREPRAQPTPPPAHHPYDQSDRPTRSDTVPRFTAARSHPLSGSASETLAMVPSPSSGAPPIEMTPTTNEDLTTQAPPTRENEGAAQATVGSVPGTLEGVADSQWNPHRSSQQESSMDSRARATTFFKSIISTAQAMIPSSLGDSSASSANTSSGNSSMIIAAPAAQNTGSGNTIGFIGPSNDQSQANVSEMDVVGNGDPNPSMLPSSEINSNTSMSSVNSTMDVGPSDTTNVRNMLTSNTNGSPASSSTDSPFINLSETKEAGDGCTTPRAPSIDLGSSSKHTTEGITSEQLHTFPNKDGDVNMRPEETPLNNMTGSNISTSSGSSLNDVNALQTRDGNGESNSNASSSSSSMSSPHVNLSESKDKDGDINMQNKEMVEDSLDKSTLPGTSGIATSTLTALVTRAVATGVVDGVSKLQEMWSQSKDSNGETSTAKGKQRSKAHGDDADDEHSDMEVDKEESTSTPGRRAGGREKPGKRSKDKIIFDTTLRDYLKGKKLWKTETKLEPPDSQVLQEFILNNQGGPSVDNPRYDWLSPLTSKSRWNHEQTNILALDFQKKLQQAELSKLPDHMSKILYIVQAINLRLRRTQVVVKDRMPPPLDCKESAVEKEARIMQKKNTNEKQNRRNGRRKGLYLKRAKIISDNSPTNPLFWEEVKAVHTALGLDGMSSDETEVEASGLSPKHVRRIPKAWLDLTISTFWRKIDEFARPAHAGNNSLMRHFEPNMSSTILADKLTSYVPSLPKNYYSGMWWLTLSETQQLFIGAKSEKPLPEIPQK